MTKPNSVDAASLHPIVHTPGPWKYHDSGSIVMTADGQMSIADIRGFGRLEKDFGLSAAIKIMDRNGQLIAAAPMMKELLLDFCDSLGDSDCIPTHRQMLAKKAALALLAEVV